MYECSGVINAFAAARSAGAKRAHYRLDTAAGPTPNRGRPGARGKVRRWVWAVGSLVGAPSRARGVPADGQQWG